MREGRTRAAAFAHALLLFALCLALSGCAIELPYHSGEDFGIPTAVSPVDFDGDGTDDYRELLLGVNIGGAGTLIASLASLITFREYTKQNKGRPVTMCSCSLPLISRF